MGALGAEGGYAIVSQPAIKQDLPISRPASRLVLSSASLARSFCSSHLPALSHSASLSFRRSFSRCSSESRCASGCGEILRFLVLLMRSSSRAFDGEVLVRGTAILSLLGRALTSAAGSLFLTPDSDLAVWCGVSASWLTTGGGTRFSLGIDRSSAVLTIWRTTPGFFLGL
jgi:hypothetical protein